MNRREAERFVGALLDARVSGSRSVIATVVRVHGSAYRHEGARLAIREDGAVHGARWGVTFERALAVDAATVFENGEPVIVTYDLADESSSSLGIGCPGTVEVLFERVEDEPVTNAWLSALETGDVAVLMTAISGAAGRRLLYLSGYSIGHFDDPSIEHLSDEMAREFLHDPFQRGGLENVGGAEVVFDISVPPTEIVIFGTGHDAEALALQACMLGYVVFVVDLLGDAVHSNRFSGAKVIFAPTESLAESVVIADGSFVVLMEHHLERDQEALRFSLDSRAAYIGVLGPRTRVRRMLSNLSRAGYVPEKSRLAVVRGPAGLSMGAETPEEVALSVVAEIMAVERGSDGGFLNGTDDTLHRFHAHGALGSMA